MADTCNCPPAQNYACLWFGSPTGLGFFQPTCQLVPSGDRVANPFYDSTGNVSYYTYGVINNCVDDNNQSIQEVFISVCENTPLQTIDVTGRPDGCPSFIGFDFDFNNTSGQTPPAGFKYLRILVDGAVGRGSAALFRIAFSGNYPAEILETSVSNTFVITTQDILAGFLAGPTIPYRLAGCPQIPRLTVTKTCDRVIANNQATLNYSVVVANSGDVSLDNVLYDDVVNYNGSNVNIGTITVDPETINVDVSTPGIVRLSGDLGTIGIGESVTISYQIPIMGFSAPGTYTFNNTATATSGDIQGSQSCTVSVDAVGIGTDKCCLVVDGNDAAFRLALTNLPNSPSTAVVLDDLMTIPSGVVIEFTSFNTCSAVFVDTGEPVPLNMPVTNRQIRIVCNTSIPQDASVSYFINFAVRSTTNFTGTPIAINNTIRDVTLQDPDSQVLLSVSPLPNNAQIDVGGFLQCPSQASE